MNRPGRKIATVASDGVRLPGRDLAGAESEKSTTMMLIITSASVNVNPVSTTMMLIITSASVNVNPVAGSSRTGGSIGASES